MNSKGKNKRLWCGFFCLDRSFFLCPYPNRQEIRILKIRIHEKNALKLQEKPNFHKNIFSTVITASLFWLKIDSQVFLSIFVSNLNVNKVKNNNGGIQIQVYKVWIRIGKITGSRWQTLGKIYITAVCGWGSCACCPSRPGSHPGPYREWWTTRPRQQSDKTSTC